ncbi:MAG: ribonuclease E inhibitor RraB [Bacteroidia bacterium]|nr:ribonuclease E inhibitor RraB [Bacteroidia bacterium]
MNSKFFKRMGLFSFGGKKATSFLTNRLIRGMRHELPIKNKMLFHMIQKQAGINDGSTLQEINVYFYTDTEAKATALAEKLPEKGVIPHKPWCNGKVWSIPGKATNLTFSEDRIQKWSAELVELAILHDCEFDGWELGIPT